MHPFDPKELMLCVTLVLKCLRGTGRVGQVYWNVAVDYWPELVEPLRATVVDPYYDESRVPEFVDALIEAAKKPRRSP